jgi:hypothetical protein
VVAPKSGSRKPPSRTRARAKSTTPSARTPPAAAAPDAAPPDAERRRALIAEAAYRRAAQRNFAPGGELEDWLAAEREVDVALQSGG